MSSIGFKNISVRRSSDGITWTEELSVTDQLAHNSTSNSLSSYIVPVAGNYNYRVQLNHFADNGSAAIEMAISSGVSAAIGIPIGAQTLLISFSE